MMRLALWVVIEGSDVERPEYLTRLVRRDQRPSKSLPRVIMVSRRHGMSALPEYVWPVVVSV